MSHLGAVATPAAMSRPYLMSRRVFDDTQASGAHICFACGFVGVPLALTAYEPSSIEERACGRCAQHSSLPVAQAAREGWLEVEP